MCHVDARTSSGAKPVVWHPNGYLLVLSVLTALLLSSETQKATMSTAHRPTWDPAQAKDVKGGSRQFSVRDMAAHTKLKFRYAPTSLSREFSAYTQINHL